MCKDNLINIERRGYSMAKYDAGNDKRNILKIENLSEFNPQIQCKAKKQMPSLWWIASLAILPMQIALYSLEWRRLVRVSFLSLMCIHLFQTLGV
jgi:hypothetical protein